MQDPESSRPRASARGFAAPRVAPSRGRERDRRIALAAILVSLVATFLTVRHVWSAVVPLIGGGALYYLFSPVTRMLERRKIPRLLSAVVLVLVLVGLVVVAIASVAPRVNAELRGFVFALPAHLESARHWLEERGDEGVAARALDDAVGRAQRAVLDPMALVVWTRSAFGSFATLALTLIVGVYLLAGGEELARTATGWIPPERRERWVSFGHASSRLLAGYVRARIIASLFIAGGYWLAFALLGLPQALLLAIVGGLLNLIPLIGPLIAAVPAMFVAAFHGWATLAGVTIAMLVAQQIESSAMGPLIEGRFVRLPPTVIVLVVALGGALLGIPGMLVAVPVAAVTRNALLVFYRGTWERPAGAPAA